jgi:hypothetical protein
VLLFHDPIEELKKSRLENLEVRYFSSCHEFQYKIHGGLVVIYFIQFHHVGVVQLRQNVHLLLERQLVILLE